MTSFSVFEPVKDASERLMQKRHHPENTVFSGLYGQKVTTLISYQNQRCWVVEVTGFEPATFWSRKMEGYPLVSAIDRNYMIIPDRKATIRFSFRFAFQGFYGCQILNRLLSGIIQVVCSGMNLIFGFGLFDMPKNIFFQLSTLASFGK